MSNVYNINEVAKIFNITTNKIRYYEKKGLIEPLRDIDNEYRKFNDEDIIKLQSILLYRSIGLSIKHIKDILNNSSNNNYLNHFNNQYEIVNSEIHKLTDIRKSIGKILDNIYEADDCSIDNNILHIIKHADELNKIRDNWKDKWDFDNWATSYDNDVLEDRGALKIYKNYNLILDNVYKLTIDSEINNPYILEIGVGTGNLVSKFLNNDFAIVGIDQSRKMLNVAKQKYPQLKVRLGEFLKIPYNDKCFDIIVSTYAFHHLNSMEKSIAIGEMIRVLKDNGKIIIGDLMFESKEDEERILKGLSMEQIEEINDEYYSHIDFLQDEFKKFNKILKYTRVDNFNYIIEMK
ncbi:MerR family transcriptional regulator [Clostridium uliginosum]|uniref:DNA-binding transcriptional regulator, MerR family n=1 Tax=Clostridium uliginosum TaxID=119641 RepID=A0A1I1NXD8_9CLOT|nr:methyltransferase domain-containing protein [Clostridium uliginosum]SFD02361.1 DNA-binding transcriptional regulator, MerR family [Clostridium uliginosum]